MIRPAVKNSLYHDVVNQVINAIKRGDWKPGDKIPGEIELADKLEVSRNVVREALKALQLLGILESTAGKGTFLSQGAMRKIHNSELVNLISDQSSMLDLLEMRMLIESQAAFLAAQRATEEEVENLEELLEQLSKILKNKSDYTEQGFDFHMSIAKISKNRFLVKLLESLADELKAQRGIINKSKLDNIVTMNDHIEIFNAIKSGEAERARDAMYSHFMNAIDAIKQD